MNDIPDENEVVDELGLQDIETKKGNKERLMMLVKMMQKLLLVLKDFIRSISSAKGLPSQEKIDK